MNLRYEIICHGPDKLVAYDVLDFVEGTFDVVLESELEVPRYPHVFVFAAEVDDDGSTCMPQEVHRYVGWDLTSQPMDRGEMQRIISAAINYAQNCALTFFENINEADFVDSYTSK